MTIDEGRGSSSAAVSKTDQGWNEKIVGVFLGFNLDIDGHSG